MDWILRHAQLDDRPAIEQLIRESARGLSRDDYSPEQIEAAIELVFGLDSDLIADQTYFVAEHGDSVVGCGGWSRRKTLFGGDRYAQREPGLLDPAHEAAKIRAFFVHPAWARKGIGRAILEACETEARRSGFRALELMGTLPGVKLYRALGFVAGDPIAHTLHDQLTITFVPMRKLLVE